MGFTSYNTDTHQSLDTWTFSSLLMTLLSQMYQLVSQSDSSKCHDCYCSASETRMRGERAKEGDRKRSKRKRGRKWVRECIHSHQAIRSHRSSVIWTVDWLSKKLPSPKILPNGYSVNYTGYTQLNHWRICPRFPDFHWTPWELTVVLQVLVTSNEPSDMWCESSLFPHLLLVTGIQLH